jgi:hypothetical protein
MLAIPRLAAGQGGIVVGVVGDGCVCPTPGEVAEQIRRQSRSISPVVGDEGPDHPVVRVTDHDSSFTVEVDGVGRQLQDPHRSCSERAAAAAVVAIVILEPPEIAESPTAPPRAPAASSFVALPPPASIPPAPDRGPPGSARYGRVTVRLSAGTGTALLFAGSDFDHAYVSGLDGKVYRATISSTGLVPDWLHFGLELGVNVSRHVNLSAQLRADTSIGADAHAWPPTHDSHVGIAKAVLVRLRYSFGEASLRPELHGGAGYGFVQPVASVGSTGDHNLQAPVATMSVPGTCTDLRDCRDTVTAGPLLLSAGGGLSYDLVRGAHGGLGLFLDLDVLGAVPVNAAYQPGLAFDVSGGLGVDFL